MKVASDPDLHLWSGGGVVLSDGSLLLHVWMCWTGRSRQIRLRSFLPFMAPTEDLNPSHVCGAWRLRESICGRGEEDTAPDWTFLSNPQKQNRFRLGCYAANFYAVINNSSLHDSRFRFLYVCCHFWGVQGATKSKVFFFAFINWVTILVTCFLFFGILMMHNIHYRVRERFKENKEIIVS